MKSDLALHRLFDQQLGHLLALQDNMVDVKVFKHLLFDTVGSFYDDIQVVVYAVECFTDEPEVSCITDCDDDCKLHPCE